MRSPRTLPSTSSASAASRIGSVSPAGEALAALPPNVPWFWICAAPMVAAASAREGRNSATSCERRIWVGRRRPDHQRIAIDPDAAQVVQRPQVQDAVGRIADLAGDLHQQVGAAGHRPVRDGSQNLVGLFQGARRDDRRFGIGSAAGVPFGCQRDGVDDLGIAGAAAQVACDGVVIASSFGAPPEARKASPAISIPGVMCTARHPSPGRRPGAR